MQWRHNERDGVSNLRRLDCLLNCLFSSRSKKTSKLCLTGLCVGNSQVTGEFPAQRAGNAEMFPFYDVIISAFRVKILFTKKKSHISNIHNSMFDHDMTISRTYTTKVVCWRMFSIVFRTFCLNVSIRCYVILFYSAWGLGVFPWKIPKSFC